MADTTTMETSCLNVLKAMLAQRGIKDANGFQTVANPAADTHMFTYNSILVAFSEKSRVSEKDLMNLVAFAQENQYSNGMIIVTPSKPSDTVLNALRKYLVTPENPLVQIFETRILQFYANALPFVSEENLRHRKVPKHRILSKEEADEVVRTYCTKEIEPGVKVTKPEFLAKIDCQDAAAKWVGARPGQILEISGLCESSGDNLRYRLCIEHAR